MTRSYLWFSHSVFTTAALSNAALAIWAPLPILSTIVLMPYGITAADPRAWLIAITAQVVFTVLVMVGRRSTTRLAQVHPRTVVVSVIVVAGTIRGAAVMWSSALAAGTDATVLEITLRAVNSAVIALPALGLAGVIVQFTRDYRHDYEQLHDRAMRLQREVVSPTQSLSDATIASWVGVQRSLQITAKVARDRLADDAFSTRSLTAAADVIAETLTTQVRPISHGLWSGSSDEPPRLRAHVVAWDALRPWQPPVSTIAILTVVVTVISAINRVGVGPGLVATAVITSAVTVVLAATAILGRHFPSSRSIGIATIVLTTPFVLVVAVLVSVVILTSPPDPLGSIVLGIAITVGIGGTAFMRRVITERQAMLVALQARIDAQALDVLTKRAQGDTWGRSLGTFVHHSVQSELTALRMQLMEAAASEDETRRAATRADALARFDRLLALQPPWLHQRSGRAVVAEVAHAWAGIATVDVTTTDTGTEDQWALAGQLVEEGVANAIRAGGARHVRVDIQHREDDSLLVTLDDDGRGVADPINPGLGTWWLDQIAPGSWERISSPTGTRLIVRLR